MTTDYKQMHDAAMRQLTEDYDRLVDSLNARIGELEIKLASETELKWRAFTRGAMLSHRDEEARAIITAFVSHRAVNDTYTNAALWLCGHSPMQFPDSQP